MRSLLKFCSVLTLGALVLAAALLAHVIWMRPVMIRAFYERVFIEYAIDDPELMSNLGALDALGLDYYSDDLTDVSIRRDLMLQEKAKADLATLREYDRSSYSGQQALSYDVLERFLQDAVDGEPFLFHDYPVTQLYGVHTGLPDFMLNVHRLEDESDAENYVTRLKKASDKFDQIVEQLHHREAIGVLPPGFVVARVVEQISDMLDRPIEADPLVVGLEQKLDALDSDTINPIRRRALLNEAGSAVRSVVRPGLRRVLDVFELLAARNLPDHGVWALPDGEAYYAYLIASHTTTDFSADEIHQMGLAEVERIEREMRTRLTEMGMVDGSPGELLMALAVRPDQVMDNAQETLELFRRQIADAEKGLTMWFDQTSLAPVDVSAVPDYAQEGSPQAYYEAGSLDGARTATFFYNPAQPIARFAMRTLAHHEAVPGHHYQISLAQRLAGVPTFRRIIPFTAFVEGWALYAERLASEAGLMEDPVDDLGRLQAEMFRAVRLVVDTGIHQFRWSRQDSINYMKAKTGMLESEVVTEVERYFVRPGQALAYKIGMERFLALRHYARAQLGAKFEPAAFHRAVLENGALPLSLLEREVEIWVEQQLMSN